MQKKAYLALFLVIALALNFWTVSPALSSTARLSPEQNTSECQSGADELTGYLATIPGVTEQVQQICEFNIRMNDLDPQLANLDSQFIEQVIVSNILEIQSLQYTLERAQSEEWRGLIEMMIAMHTHDLEMALAVAEKYIMDPSPDLTNVLVYPGTPNYDLGMRNVDLMAQFLNPLMNAGGAVPTVTATATVTSTGAPPTDTPTQIPTLDTMTPIVTSTVDLTSTTTAIPTLDTATPTETMTATFTPLPTDTPTTVPSFTPTTTGTSNVDLTGTTTGIPPLETTTPSVTSIVDLNGTPTVTLAFETTTPTITPTTPGSLANFDMVSLHIIEEEHVMHVQTALAAQRLVQNDEIRAFAKHTADLAQLHLLLMSDLKHRLFDFYTPPTPDFQREYQAPREFLPDAP